MKSIEFLKEETITLKNLYKNSYPDDRELIWNYVGKRDFDTPFEINILSKHKVLFALLGQYNAEHVDEIVDKLNPEQIEILDYYKKQPNISDNIIVMSDGKIVDGNHRALAAALMGKPIRYIDLNDTSI